MAFKPPHDGYEFPAVNESALQRLVERYYPYNLLFDVFQKDFHAVMHAYPDNIPKALDTLSAREKETVINRYYYGLTLQTIADQQAVTTERIRQIIAKAVRKLGTSANKSLLTAMPLSDLEARDDTLTDLRNRCDVLEAALTDKGRDPAGIPMPTPPSLSEKPITDLGLSVRALNALWRRDIDTVGRLASMSADQILRLRNVGRSTFDEIHKTLLAHGLDFETEYDGPQTDTETDDSGTDGYSSCFPGMGIDEIIRYFSEPTSE